MPVLVKLNRQIDEILADPEVRARFIDLQITGVGGNLGDARAYVEDDRSRWGNVVKAAGVQAE